MTAVNHRFRNLIKGELIRRGEKKLNFINYRWSYRFNVLSSGYVDDFLL